MKLLILQFFSLRLCLTNVDIQRVYIYIGIKYKGIKEKNGRIISGKEFERILLTHKIGYL